MLVRCITNKISEIKDKKTAQYVAEKYQATVEDDFHLKKSKNYVVFSIAKLDNNPWFYICDEAFTSYPYLYPIWFFDIISTDLSKYWVLNGITSYEEFTYDQEAQFLTFKEWANDEYFYGNLIEGYIDEINIFKKYKEFMELEFQDPSVKDTPNVLEDKWVMCQICDEAWEEFSTEGMIICPKCKKTQLNPFYIKD